MNYSKTPPIQPPKHRGTIALNDYNGGNYIHIRPVGRYNVPVNVCDIPDLITMLQQAYNDLK